MSLTAQQAEAYKVLRWLISMGEGDRRTGRTYVMALVYLSKAAEVYLSETSMYGYSNGWVTPNELHPNTETLTKILVHQIQGIARSYESIIEIRDGNTFRITHLSSQLLRVLDEINYIPPKPIAPKLPPPVSHWKRLSEED
jgi:hypothetical protein